MSGEAHETIVLGARSYALDAHGFLAFPEQWDEQFAEAMAERVGVPIPLDERQWSFVNYVREKFLTERDIPPVVVACLDNKIRLAQFRAMFPPGYFRGVCRVAGVDHQFIFDTNAWLTYETSPMVPERYPLTAAGFLQRFDRWDEAFAELVATEMSQGRPLSESHWSVLRSLRQAYQRSGVVPTLFETCRESELSFERFHELFPAGYRRGACRMAGLPFFG